MNSYMRQQGQPGGMRNNRFMQGNNDCDMENSCLREGGREREERNFPLAMAYVPWQMWRDVVDGGKGLAQGTIFNELVLNFGCANKCCSHH
jgi:hypothetical protein